MIKISGIKYSDLVPLFSARSFFVLPCLLWLLLTALSYYWDHSSLASTAAENVARQGRLIHQFVLSTSRWNAEHSQHHLPVPSRESGHEQAEFNPGHQHLAERLSVGALLVQLSGPRPEASDTKWQANNFERLLSGATEVLSKADGRYRYSVPMVLESSCMDCHGQQQEGELAGMLSVSFPNGYMADNYRPLHLQNLVSHLIAFTALTLITLAGSLVIRRLLLDLAEETAKRQALLNQKTESLQLEISRHKSSKRKLRELASRDELTGIYNRRHFVSALGKELHRHKRYHSEFSLLLIDIDRLKHINEIFGHDCGDAVLSAVADAINQRLREIDIFARYSGEEFVILAPNTRLDSGMRFARKLADIVRQLEFTYEEHALELTISIGVASPMLQSKPTEVSLLDLADTAMRQAKEQGRDQVVNAKDLVSSLS